MAKRRPRREKKSHVRAEILDKLDSLDRDANSLYSELTGLEHKISDLESKLANLPARILRIREMNYKVLTHLERDEASVSDRWANIGPDLKRSVRDRVEELRSEFNNLKRKLSQRRRDVGFKNVRLRGIESRLGGLRTRVIELKNDVSNTLSEFESRLRGLEKDLSVAEATVELTSQASFPWKEEESPIFAVVAKDMNNEIEGIVTLTNHRFIFESERDVVLKKSLFIATEKKKVREVVVDQPIGIIDRIHKGKVGFLAGHGVFINFKPDSRLKEMKLDTKGHEADKMLRYYNYITSGEAEKELATLEKEEGIEEKKEREPLICEICGASYTDEVYRGQTSVQCRYCGAVMPLS